MWLPASGLILQFKHSKQYQRTLLCLFGWVMFVLWNMPCLTYVKLLGTIVLVGAVGSMIWEGLPTGSVSQLHYSNHQWAVYCTKRTQWVMLTSVTLFLRTDFLILLQLNSPSPPPPHLPKTLLIWRDQVSDAQFRRLMWLLSVPAQRSTLKP